MHFASEPPHAAKASHSTASTRLIPLVYRRPPRDSRYTAPRMEVSLDDVQLRHGPVVALERLTASFPQGTRALVWGPAACGKTSLLKAIAGLLRPSRGAVRWDGRDVAALSSDQRRDAQAAVGMIFQTDALFDSMTVLDNVLLPLLKRRVPRDEALRRAQEALAQVGLEDAAAKRPEQLSGGMKKRAGVARAIVARPKVLLADDPFAGLDPITEASIANLLLEVSAGRTLIAAVPDPTASLPMARWIRLDGGEVLEDGPPRALDAPA